MKCFSIMSNDQWSCRVHYLRLCIGTDTEEFAKRHTQALVEIMVDPAICFDPLCVPLQQVKDQGPEVAGEQQSIVLLQQKLSQTSQNALSVLLAPYLQTERHIRGKSRLTFEFIRTCQATIGMGGLCLHPPIWREIHQCHVNSVLSKIVIRSRLHLLRWGCRCSAIVWIVNRQMHI